MQRIGANGISDSVSRQRRPLIGLTLFHHVKRCEAAPPVSDRGVCGRTRAGYDRVMKPRLLGWMSPQTHRRIDLLTLPALVAAAAGLGRRGRRAAAGVLATAAVEGLATATTNYPPPVLGGAIGFRAHNRWAASHGLLVAALAAWLPGLT